MKAIFLSYKYNDRIVLLQNFKGVGQTLTQSGLHMLKIKKFDVCTRPLFKIRSHIIFKVMYIHTYVHYGHKFAYLQYGWSVGVL